ncbi:MAG TPA: MBL fold metallo-hydrolase [Aeromicrobium sp.]|nr:MBL fold metallo-hydrolase [Aeromicrobium sp.]
MRVRIHRGAHEIGGSCVEVEAGGSRLVLDVGRPLSAAAGDVVPLPSVAGFVEADPSLAGIVISHAHQDHWGLVGQVPPGVPVFMGQATHAILAEAAFWSTGLVVSPAGFLQHRVPFEVGAFRVTPFLNDHSAFDAYSVLVECEGKSLFYTGDIRGHGRKSGIFEELLRKPPADVDVLLMEGTNIRPTSGGDANTEGHVSEAQLELACAKTFKATSGMVLVSFSAQNVDRLVTMYRAALRADRDLVVDLYTASIARATGNPNIPQPSTDWPRLHVFMPLRQRVQVKDAKEFARVKGVEPFRLYAEDLAANPAKFVTKFTPAERQRLATAGCLDGSHAGVVAVDRLPR